MRGSGKRVLAYFEIGSIEDFRPEYPALPRSDLVLNRVGGLARASTSSGTGTSAGGTRSSGRGSTRRCGPASTGCTSTPRWPTRRSTSASCRARPATASAADMVDLIVRISAYAKAAPPGFWIVPQNSPELRHHARLHRRRSTASAWRSCSSSPPTSRAPRTTARRTWRNTRALRDAGKFVLGRRLRHRAGDVRAACARYRAEGFAGYVTDGTSTGPGRRARLTPRADHPTNEREEISNAHNRRRHRDGLRRPHADRRAGPQGLRGPRGGRVARRPRLAVAGRPHIFEPGVEEVFAEHIGKSHLRRRRRCRRPVWTSRCICVSTPVDEQTHQPNLTNLAAAARAWSPSRAARARWSWSAARSRSAPAGGWCCPCCAPRGATASSW